MTKLLTAAALMATLSLTAGCQTNRQPASASDIANAEESCKLKGFLPGSLNFTNCVRRNTSGRVN